MSKSFFCFTLLTTLFLLIEARNGFNFRSPGIRILSLKQIDSASKPFFIEFFDLTDKEKGLEVGYGKRFLSDSAKTFPWNQNTPYPSGSNSNSDYQKLFNNINYDNQNKRKNVFDQAGGKNARGDD